MHSRIEIRPKASIGCTSGPSTSEYAPNGQRVKRSQKSSIGSGWDGERPALSCLQLGCIGAAGSTGLRALVT